MTQKEYEDFIYSLTKSKVAGTGCIFIAAYQAQENKEVLPSLLAEFCEPLIERTAEKPEGGQDAAKA